MRKGKRKVKRKRKQKMGLGNEKRKEEMEWGKRKGRPVKGAETFIRHTF